MTLSSSDLVDAHAVAGPLDEIIERRRATYDAAVELASGGSMMGCDDPAVIDHPLVRHHLGDVLAGLAEFDADALTSIDSLITETCRWLVAEQMVRVASAPQAPRALDGAIRRIGAQLEQHQAAGLADVVLVDGHPRFDAGLATLRDGVELALAAAPELIGDLLPHIGLIALLDGQRAGRLGSASAREYPGLIVLPEPATPLEAAEALVHEGAHQKLFDAAIVGSIFASDHHAAPAFTPPWAATGAPGWPFEQTVAAFHAYSCLATFATTADLSAIHSYSLLPQAAERATVLGDWIDRHLTFLGPDGRGPSWAAFKAVPPADESTSGGFISISTQRGKAAQRRCGSWMLLMKWGRPVEIRWIRAGKHSSEAATSRAAPDDLVMDGSAARRH